MRTVVLQSVRNVRDLGGIPVAGGRAVRPGLIYRGGALARLTPDDARELFGKRGIARVVDLRCGYEVEAKPDRCPGGVERAWIPYFDEDEVGIGYFKPIANTVAIGHDFACDSRDFYAAMANPLTVGQMRRAVTAVLESAAAGEPVYFHCSGGKDRAGVTALLVLTVLGASREAILEDYLLTNRDRAANFERTYERFLRLCQGDENFALRVTKAHDAHPENLASFYAQVDGLYGGMDAFVERQLGMDEARREELRLACTRPQDCKSAAMASSRERPGDKARILGVPPEARSAGPKIRRQAR